MTQQEEIDQGWTQDNLDENVASPSHDYLVAGVLSVDRNVLVCITVLRGDRATHLILSDCSALFGLSVVTSYLDR